MLSLTGTLRVCTRRRAGRRKTIAVQTSSTAALLVLAHELLSLRASPSPGSSERNLSLTDQAAGESRAIPSPGTSLR
jgi:hypothetical protein